MGIFKKLSEISREIGFIEFDGHNPMYSKDKSRPKANFASAAGVIRKLNSELGKHGVVCTVAQSLTEYREASGVAVARLQLRFTDVEDESFVLTWGEGSGKDSGDKAVMKASTAAFKYGIAHALMLGWGAEDPEADTTTDTPAKKGAKTPKEANDFVSELTAAIATAATQEDLEKLKMEISKMDLRSPEAKKLVKQWNNRKTEVG